MDQLPTHVQVPGDRPLAQSLMIQRDDVLIAGVSVRAADLPTSLGSREQAWVRCT